MMKRIRFNSRSVMTTWLISYISVLLVPIIISVIIYIATLRIVENEVNRSNELLLTQIEQAIDSKLKSLEQLTLEIAYNKKVTSFINVSAPLTDEDHFQLFGIAGDVRIFKMANDFISQLYVYYRNSNTVLSSYNRMNSETLYSVLRQTKDTKYEEWSDYFAQKYIQGYTPVLNWTDKGVEKSVMYARTILGDFPDSSGAVIMFVMKDSKLLETIPPQANASVLIMDKQNRVVATNVGEQDIPSDLQYDMLTGAKGLFYEKGADGRKLALSYTTSDVTGWKYVSLIPADVYSEKMDFVKTVTLWSVFLCFLFGGIVTYLFLRKNYLPIRTLIESLSKKAGVAFDIGSNEYVFFQAAMNNTFAEKEEVYRRLKQHHNAIRSHFLRRLLKGQTGGGVPLHESLAAHDIVLRSNQFAVLLFHVENYGKFNDSSEQPRIDHKAQTLYFVITNVIEELAGAENPAYTVEMDDVLACIINMNTAERDSRVELQRIADSAKAFIKEHIHAELTVAISGVQEELMGIAQAYQEAMEAMEYRIVMGSGEIISYEELKDNDAERTRRTYDYPLHVEQQFIYFIKTGNVDKAQELLEQIFEKNVSGISMPVRLAKCLMFDLVSTMLKTIDEVNASSRKEFFDQADLIDRLMGCETIKEMKVHINNVLLQVCEYINEDKKNHHKHFVEQIQEYVKEHYNEESLNISMIGGAFDLTPSYVSRLFKEYTGEALLDFINKTRLEEAKKLLNEQKYTVNEVAGKVGYSDVNTFLRIFKKFEGITPGKYTKTPPQ
ncbi:helix-turn-helix domain-containing protein [Paenibacillus sp. UNC451MF]|uniref:helix-turn-helix domain-containing protein n=1 Tax=Paenibacillus sp. UNC451MF TaxID=1449063 RepID=UPI00048A69CB|nr:helix-turn-helix domain-containing protein [Paenibacillus sp. UNC451MF]